MGRRGRNEGTITKRADGRWEARISLPDGTRRSFYGKTRQEVAQRLTQARHEVDRGLPLLDERQTVGQYLETWLETMKLHVRPSTWRRYKNQIRLHLIPGLGKIALVKLPPQQVQVFYVVSTVAHLCLQSWTRAVSAAPVPYRLPGMLRHSSR